MCKFLCIILSVGWRNEDQESMLVHTFLLMDLRMFVKGSSISLHTCQFKYWHRCLPGMWTHRWGWVEVVSMHYCYRKRHIGHHLYINLEGRSKHIGEQERCVRGSCLNYLHKQVHRL